MEDKIMLLAVAFEPEKNTYVVDIGQGSNVAETAFAMTVVIKCLLKDGVINQSSEVTDLITKYLTDPQYDEVKDDEEA